MKRKIRFLAPAALVIFAACERTTTETLVARAGDYELTAAAVAELLGPHNEIPNEPGAVGQLAGLWIDYTLLTDATLRDTTYSQIDVSELLEQQLEGELIADLSREVIQPDTAISDEELREIFVREGTGVRVNARHILMTYPPQASDAQRDSVRRVMQGVLQRLASGEDFATLAQNVSQDRGSGAQGGALGEFGPGDMVQPFEDAAFALAPGETSGLVETPYGLHIIRVDSKSVPTFDERKDEFRFEIQARRYQEAESLYVAELEAESEPEVAEGAVQLFKSMAEGTTGRLTPRAARRELVTYRGGAVTAADVLVFLDTRAPQTREQIISAPAPSIENLLLALAQRKLFIQAARDAGLEKPESYLDSLAGEFRAGFGQAAAAIGLGGLTVPEGATVEEVVQEAVFQLLDEVLDGTRNPVPLGPVGFTLRRNTRWELFETGVPVAVDRIWEMRGPGQAMAPPTSTPAPTSETPDTTGDEGGA